MYTRNLKLYTAVEKYLWIARVEKVDSASCQQSKERVNRTV